MAIDDFAPSLLANARKQNKASKKNDLTYSLAKLAGKGLKSAFTSALTASSDAFQQNEKLMAEKIKYKEAVTSSSGFIETQKRIDESGKTDEEYFYEDSYESVKAKLKTDLPLEISGNERLFDSFIRKRLDPMTKYLAEEHAKGLKLSGTIDTFENYTTDFNTKLKKARPDNVGDALFGSIGRLFSGKTKAEQEAEVLAAIRTGPMSTSATAMTAFEEQYAKTKNAVRSFNFADFLSGAERQKIADEEKDIVVNIVESHTVTSDGDILLTTITKTNDKVNEEINTTSKIEKVDSFTDPKEDKLKQAKSMTSALNLGIVPQQVLKPQAFANFAKSVSNMDLNPYNISTPEQHIAISKVFATFVSDYANLKDSFSEGVFTASVSSFASGASSLPALMLSLKNSVPGSPENIKYKKQLENARISFFEAAGEVQNVLNKNQAESVTQVMPRSVMPPAANKHSAFFNKAQWSTFTPEQKAVYNAMTAAQIKDALNL